MSLSLFVIGIGTFVLLLPLSRSLFLFPCSLPRTLLVRSTQEALRQLAVPLALAVAEELKDTCCTSPKPDTLKTELNPDVLIFVTKAFSLILSRPDAPFQ